jgi:hypothetical protein
MEEIETHTALNMKERKITHLLSLSTSLPLSSASLSSSTGDDSEEPDSSSLSSNPAKSSLLEEYTGDSARLI